LCEKAFSSWGRKALRIGFFLFLSRKSRRGFLRPRLVRRDASGLGPTSEKMTKNADAFESAFWWSAFATARAWTFFSSRGALISFKHTHHHETTTTTHLFPRLLVPSLGTRANPSSQPRLSADYPRYPGLRSSTRTPCSSLGTSRAVLKSDIESPFFSLMDIQFFSRTPSSSSSFSTDRFERALSFSLFFSRSRTHTHTHTHTLSLSLSGSRKRKRRGAVVFL